MAGDQRPQSILQTSLWLDESSLRSASTGQTISSTTVSESLLHWVQARRRNRQITLLATAAALLLCCSLLVWVVLWLRPARPVELVLIGSGYETNLNIPHNVYGFRTLIDLTELVGTNAGQLMRLTHEPRLLRSDSDWKADLAQVKASTAIIYLALHGAADSDGAYLLPSDSTPSQPALLRLDAVLDQLADMPATTNKLLILDATQVQSSWAYGYLNNDFARVLRSLDQRIRDIPNLVVVCSSDADQRSWPLEEFGRTAFGYSLIEGLRGAATDADSDGRLDAAELFDYVRDWVRNWVQLNREALQEPILLPTGAEGRQRAKSMVLAFTRPYTPPDYSELPVYVPPDSIREAWSSAERLNAMVPAPAVYTPHLWHGYLELLLRFEQLTVAGSSDAAATIQRRLAVVERQIRRKAVLNDLRSLGNTLSLAVIANGQVSMPNDAMRQQAAELWNASDADLPVRWSAIEKEYAGKDQAEFAAFQLTVQADVLDRVIGEVALLPRAVRVLRVVESPTRPRPVESHTALLYDRDLPSNTDDIHRIATKQGLLLAKRIEELVVDSQAQTHYGEQILPWISDMLIEADQLRLAGQDLLFARDPANWAEAKRLLDQAAQQCEQISTIVKQIQKALSVRDQLSNYLPAVTCWYSVRRMPENQTRRQQMTQELQNLRHLWDTIHQMNHRLDQPAKDRTARLRQANELADIAQQIASQLEDAKLRLRNYFEQLSSASLQSVWRDTHDLLSVPLGSPEARVKLVVNQRRTSREFLIRTSNNPEKKPISATENLQQVQEVARRRGQMAVAILGQTYFDTFTRTNSMNAAQVLHALERFIADPRWWELLGRCGSEIGKRWRELPISIEQLLEQAKSDDATTAQSSLARAANLSRYLDGPTALTLIDNPCDLYRRLQVQNLLLLQARRLLQQHYFDIDPTREPYFQAAGRLYLDDAKTLREAKTALDALAAEYANSGELQFKRTEPRVDLAGVASVPVHFSLELKRANTTIPTGRAVVSVQAGKDLALVGDQHFIRSVGGKDPPSPVTSRVVSPLAPAAEANPPSLPTVVNTSLEVTGLYRGQIIKQLLPVSVYLLPELRSNEYPIPANASVAIRAAGPVIERYGAGNGALAFVLDCTGSMGNPEGGPPRPGSKYAQALDAFRQILAGVPRGTQVSVWVFGQAVGPLKAVERAEDTITQILPPTPWNPNDPAQLKTLLDKLSKLEPYNQSPILRAMLRAKADLQNTRGLPSLIVITDGMDNRFERDPVLQKLGKDIPSILRAEFADTPIAVHVLGFRVTNTEEQQFAKQFQVVNTFSPPSRFRTVQEVGELVRSLENAMRQELRYRIDTPGNTAEPGESPLGIEIAKSGGNDKWYTPLLTPGGRKLRIFAGQRLDYELKLNAGDRLLLELTAPLGQLQLQRIGYAATDFPSRPALTTKLGDWRAAVLENRLLPEGAARWLCTLEAKPDPAELILEQIRPRLVWFEINALDAANPFALNWAYQPGYPAPAYDLACPSWPVVAGTAAPTRPVLKCWFNPDQDPRPAVVLDRGADYAKLADLTGKRLSVGGSDVAVESVAVEQHTLAVGPSRRAVKSCLVVRLSYPVGQPVMIMPQFVGRFDRQRGGAEHRFYTAAGKYIGLFWNDDPAFDPAEQLQRLPIYSIVEFKDLAEQRGFSFTFDRLEVPQPFSRRPAPIFAEP